MFLTDLPELRSRTKGRGEGKNEKQKELTVKSVIWERWILPYVDSCLLYDFIILLENQTGNHWHKNPKLI